MVVYKKYSGLLPFTQICNSVIMNKTFYKVRSDWNVNVFKIYDQTIKPILTFKKFNKLRDSWTIVVLFARIPLCY